MGKMTIGSSEFTPIEMSGIESIVKNRYNVEEVVETIEKPVFQVFNKSEILHKPVYKIEETVIYVTKPVYIEQEERIEVVRQAEVKAKKLVAAVISDLQAVSDLNLHLKEELNSERELRKWLLVGVGASVVSSITSLLVVLFN